MQTVRQRILCLDDHEDTCEMMKIMLGGWGYEVALARTVAAGLHLAQSERFDLYLLDSHLRDGSGFELCKRICAIAGHAPVMFISGEAYETDKQRGLTAGAVAYLAKPVEFEELKITVARLLTKIGREDRKDLQDDQGVYHSRKAQSDSAIAI